MSLTIYSIGHSNDSLDTFLQRLKAAAISIVVDVRSHPTSKFVPHFKKQALHAALRTSGFEYRFFGRQLGGRPADPNAYDPHGRVDYAARALAEEFVQGIDELVRIATKSSTAIMCAEENPSACHRSKLIAPALVQRHIKVIHLRKDGLQTQHTSSSIDPRKQLQLF